MTNHNHNISNVPFLLSRVTNFLVTKNQLKLVKSVKHSINSPVITLHQTIASHFSTVSVFTLLEIMRKSNYFNPAIILYSIVNGWVISDFSPTW